MNARSAAPAVVVCAVFAMPGMAQASNAGDAALAKFSKAWNAVRSYTCTIEAHEVRGPDVQDRVYHVAFERPNNMRMDIVGGAGKGGAAVWAGGDTLYGHQGGILSFVRLHLNIHDAKAVSLRGTTVAQASFGALLARFERLRKYSLDARPADGAIRLTARLLDPAAESGVTSEVLIFGANQLPVEYDQYVGNQLVDRVRYSNYKGNVALPASTWKI